MSFFKVLLWAFVLVMGLSLMVQGMIAGVVWQALLGGLLFGWGHANFVYTVMVDAVRRKVEVILPDGMKGTIE